MKKIYKKSLFIFRRDLRLYDNVGLLHANKLSKVIILCFIFDPRQVTKKNKFRSMNAIQFMVESLQDLEKKVRKKRGKLYCFYGIAEQVIEQLIKKEKINALFLNKDYTPFSLKRDKAIEKICHTQKIDFLPYHDLLLNQPNLIMTNNNTPYSIFTPFYKKAIKIPVENPINKSSLSSYKKPISQSKTLPFVSKKILVRSNKRIHIHGGRDNGLKILKNLKQFKNYAKERNFPSIATTNLSGHLKFGTLSIRETYKAIQKKLGKKHPLLKQLYWRDFFTYVAYHSPFVFGQPYHERYKKLSWSKNKKFFNAWCSGNTGFPFVDAGMRQLNETGFMHNRTRMIVASFLVKDLHINWLWGEKYFAQQLLDYDPAVNNGNWQWSASTGCDAQPYFRIFNPWLQQKKFDPDCIYIKKWIPELQKTENKIIHSWFKQKKPTINYPSPLVEHSKETKKTKILYKKAK